MDPRLKQQGIAVIGVACYYPGAANTRELWENILARRVQFRRMIDQRLPLSEYFDEDPKTPEKTYGTKAAFIENFFFDWMKLRIPKKTFKSTDIAHWLALDTALRTFEDAGYQPVDIPLANTGVIVGNTLTGEQTRSQTLRLRWPYVQKVLNATLSNAGMGVDEISRLASDMEKVYKSAFYPITEDSLAGGLANTIAGRICNFLNLKGGGYIVDGACSSSLLAVATAANALKLGDMDLVLAGGVDVSLDPFELVGFAKAGALAKEHMRVYDQRASGFVPGEGCGFVLLKRLEDALRDKNYIYAVINGWGISSDGKGGIMEPSVSGQALAIQRAYKDLGYKTDDVDFVEGHGTGTTKGDRVELEGIATAVGLMGKEGHEGRSCGVTSFKSIVGHTKAAAGVGGLIKTILAVNQRVLPPTANCAEPNDVFKDKAKHLYPLIHGAVLAQDRTVRAGVSSAGFGGINCHITIESKDAPKPELKPTLDERALLVSHQETEVFVFAARTTQHLKKVISRFKEDLRFASYAEMADLAALLGRKVKGRLPVKAAIVTDSPEHLYDALTLLENEIDGLGVEEGRARTISHKLPATHIVVGNAVKKIRIGFLYPGQGSQRLNMTRALVERFPWARDFIGLSGLGLYDRIYKTADKALTREEQQTFEKQLADTRFTQPAVVTSSAIWTGFLSRLGIEPQCVGGHSLGELTAFYKAGVFDGKSLVKFSEFRGAVMADGNGPHGGMVSLACSRQKAESLVSKIPGNIVIANINSPLQIVVSGGKEEIEKVIALATLEGVAFYQLKVSNAFHSSFMRDAADKIRKSSLVACSYKKSSVDVYSAIDGSLIKEGVDLRDYFARQVVAPVSFVELVKALSGQCDILIEVGHGRVLTDLVAASNKDEGPLCLPVESSPGKDADINRVLAELFIRNVAVRWEELYVHRLIKTFVPASRKKFIMNHCERPLKIGEQVLKTKTLDINSPEPASGVEDPGGLPVNVDDKDVIGTILVDLVHKLTGFDTELISLESRLLDDLNLDSIKAAELIAQAARVLGVAGQLDPSQISNNRLGQIRDRLYEVLLKSGRSGETRDDDLFSRYRDRTCVRNFVVKLRPEEIVFQDLKYVKGLKNIMLLSDKNEQRLFSALAAEFREACVTPTFFGDEGGSKERSAATDCLIVVLPRGKGCDSMEQGLKGIMERMRQVIDAATAGALPEGGSVVLVQFSGGYFGEQGPVDNIAACCGKALMSTLFLERPDLKVRVIDVAVNADDARLAGKIAAEMATDERFSAVGYDVRMTRRVVDYTNSEPVFYQKRDISWSKKDVVVVTGGAKGVTAVCALEFARITKARMILVGRSPVPAGAHDASNEIVQILDKYRQQGLNGHYFQCDVTREADVIRVLDDVRRQFGKITGFIHGAGLNSLKRLKQSTAAEAYQESLPKVMGAVNVCRALSDEPLKLIVGITSIIGITGMQGSGWYGLANEILNLYLHQFRQRHPATQVVAIAYSVWDEVGMGAKLGSVDRLFEQGISAIPVAEGVRRFVQLVHNDPGVQQVIVAARLSGLDTWRSRPAIADHFRFLENVRYFMPGVEIMAQARLSVRDDPYLLDHNWRGSLLFPFVFGFEAMAQAVARLTGVGSLERIRADDIILERPIPVSSEYGTTIEIHAQAIERDGKDDSRRVKVVIYSEETSFQQPHFSAVFEIDPVLRKQRSVSKRCPQQRPPIDLDVHTDVYGPILFQGKMFQCIDRIHDLHFDEKAGKGSCVFTSLYNRTALAFLKGNKKFSGGFLTGDPFFNDALLQSMQVIIPRDISLPVGIGRIEFDLASGLDTDRLATCRIKKIDADHYRGDVVLSNNGAFVRIEDCRLKVLDILVSNPSATELADPARRDQKVIDGKVAALARELGFTAPVIRCLHDHRLKAASKALRRKIELPLIKKAAEEFLQKIGKPSVSVGVKWLKSGKPVLAGKNIPDVGVSVAHKGTFLLVVVGAGEQGCDVELDLKKPLSYWTSVLGRKKTDLLLRGLKEGGVKADPDRYAAAFWCAYEAQKKSLGLDGELRLAESSDKGLVFRSAELDRKASLIVAAVGIGRDREMAVAFVVYKRVAASVMETVGYREDIFKMGWDPAGPQGQPVFMQRFPVTFKNGQSLNRNVYFSNYFDWIGQVREYALYPVKQELTRLFKTGDWGMATNYVKLKVLGDLTTDDVVESRLRLHRISGYKDAVLDLMFDWFRVLPGGQHEKVAESEQRVSWIRITGHGEARLEGFPAPIRKFIDVLKPQEHISGPAASPGAGLFRGSDIGKEVPIQGRHSRGDILLREDVVRTSLEDSNLVGNIYFSNYAKWLGRTRDHYFRELMPKHYQGKGENGEFICLHCDVYHLMEAMPFDRVKIRMHLKKAYESGLDLYFEFFKLLDDGKEIKIVHARHQVVFGAVLEGSFISRKLPVNILDAISSNGAVPSHHA